MKNHNYQLLTANPVIDFCNPFSNIIDLVLSIVFECYELSVLLTDFPRFLATPNPLPYRDKVLNKTFQQSRMYILQCSCLLTMACRHMGYGHYRILVTKTLKCCRFFSYMVHLYTCNQITDAPLHLKYLPLDTFYDKSQNPNGTSLLQIFQWIS